MAKKIVFVQDNETSRQLGVFPNSKGEVTFEVFDSDDDSGYYYQNISLPKGDVEILIKELSDLIQGIQ